jgi:hypothetical protein
MSEMPDRYVPGLDTDPSALARLQREVEHLKEALRTIAEPRTDLKDNAPYLRLVAREALQ